MIRKSILTSTWCIGLFFLCFLAAASCSAKNDTSEQESTPKETSSYTVPAEKTQKWESLKNVARKDYDICQEHCAYEQSCLEKCEAAYKARLEREYMMLLEEKVQGSDK